MFDPLVYFDKRGEPITLQQWARLKGDDDEYSRVAQWHGEGVTLEGQWIAHLWVSTVWIGLNLSFSTAGHRAIFETMVFGEDEIVGGTMVRYSTEEDAVAGHNRTVECLQAGIAPFSWAEVGAP